ncbi:MAG: protein kinase, partial [Planctomycetes bacterium]|nr:protein kinase [Planctomycetota bacterium]
MTTPPRHRKSDLLCALLAQQMSLITRDQLLEAANLWLEDPARPMSALLQELGHLGPDEVSMLLEAVEMHKSPTGSGTAMERATTVDPDVREALLALRPPVEIRQWLVRLHDRRRAVPVPPPVPPASRAARYDLGEEIARGGLGRVVEAHDRDLDRDVAVKLVLDDLAPEAAARFAREAKLTARLDHPSIVPIHDFGTLPGPDGRARLFLCMKRIRGRDLGATLQGLASGNVELKAKWTRARMLGVFQDICLG